LNVHIKKVPAADDVKLKDIARGTPGFSGAELANVVNEKPPCLLQDLIKHKST